MKMIKTTVHMSPAALADFMYDFENEEVKNRMFNLEDSTTSVDVTFNGELVVFGILSDLQLLELVELYNATGLKYTVEDVTIEALNSFYKSKDEAVIEALASNWKMQEMTHEYVSKYAEVNDVLDKISKYGVESLNEADQFVLKNI